MDLKLSGSRTTLAVIALCLTQALSSAAAPASFDRMRALYDRKDYAALEKLCRKELQNKKLDRRASLEPLYFLAAGRVAQGDYRSAVPCLVEFRDAHLGLEKEKSRIGVPYSLLEERFRDMYFELGKLFFEKQDFRESLAWFNKAGTSPALLEDPAYHYRMGVCLLNTGDYPKAREHFLREMRLDPAEPGPLYNMACAYAREGNKRQAVLWLKKAVDANPDFVDIARADKDFDSVRTDREFPVKIH